MIKRIIKCDVCGRELEEPIAGTGWSGWGSLNGIVLNGVSNPNLCPEHLAQTADYIDRLKEGLGNGLD